MAQPQRFATRTRILTDLSISEGSRLLYLFLDDQARGESRLALKQLRAAVMMGITTREFRYRIGELCRAGYMTMRRTLHGNVYDFSRNTCSDAEGNTRSARIGTGVPVHPYEQEATRTSPTPPMKKERCQWCHGKGARPGCVAGTCPGCDGSGIANFRDERRTA